jgi:hypothetical protein
MAEHLIKIGDDRGVAEPCEFERLDLDLIGDAGVLMDEKQRRSSLGSLWISDIAGNRIFFRA